MIIIQIGQLFDKKIGDPVQQNGAPFAIRILKGGFYIGYEGRYGAHRCLLIGDQFYPAGVTKTCMPPRPEGFA
jgi:hypothetical protein